MERTTALITFRPGAEAGLSGALGGMGLSLPAMGRFTDSGGLVLARTAPGQILAMRAGEGVALMEELASMQGVAGLIDLSDARFGVRVAGPHAAEGLALLLPIDLHPSRFGPGQCANTLMAHLSVLVLRHGPADYELQCGRSFAGSFLRAIGGAIGGAMGGAIGAAAA
jgi:sarcosine oxidase subunit gamma